MESDNSLNPLLARIAGPILQLMMQCLSVAQAARYIAQHIKSIVRLQFQATQGLPEQRLSHVQLAAAGQFPTKVAHKSKNERFLLGQRVIAACIFPATCLVCLTVTGNQEVVRQLFQVPALQMER